ncbi:MAG: reverse transcriptase domain-containing protein [Paraclostridium sordellii]|nr:RNA-directed DNA polymerase [Paeniclostridium sordellii]
MYKEKFNIKYIPKNKGYRKIVTYKNSDCDLKKFHIKISRTIYNNTLPSKFAKAYIRKRSIITNAKAHKYNDIYIFFDIKDFFQNINHNKLIEKLYFEINIKRKKKISKLDCYRIVKSCSLSNKGLGVGLIPSPILSNIYLKELDNILYGRLKKFGLPNVIYTRYADDMVISFKKCDKYNLDEIELLVKNLLTRYGLKMNNNKTKVINLEKSNHVRITGINISKDSQNKRYLTVGRKRKNQLYHDVIKLLNIKKEDRDKKEINRVKGMQSFILSVEGISYEDSYSLGMIKIIEEFGFTNLKEAINSL